MTKNMTPYYVSRAVISVAFGAVFFLTGSPWWMAILITVLILAFFLWAPHSGRYAVHPEFGVTALRRDDRTQVINDKAARNAFVFTILVIGAIAVYAGVSGIASISITVIKVVIAAGALAYFVSDLWLRRS